MIYVDLYYAAPNGGVCIAQFGTEAGARRAAKDCDLWVIAIRDHVIAWSEGVTNARAFMLGHVRIGAMGIGVPPTIRTGEVTP